MSALVDLLLRKLTRVGAEESRRKRRKRKRRRRDKKSCAKTHEGKGRIRYYRSALFACREHCSICPTRGERRIATLVSKEERDTLCLMSVDYMIKRYTIPLCPHLRKKKLTFYFHTFSITGESRAASEVTDEERTPAKRNKKQRKDLLLRSFS